MAQSNTQTAFGRFLKFWRDTHNIKQEVLAFKINSSARHLSRLENGISRPSESIIEDIARELSLGERDKNHLLISAGYAPILKKVDFNSPQMKWLRKAMIYNLKALDPHPSALIDSLGNILMVNKAWVGFYREKCSISVVNDVTNIYDFLFNSEEASNGVNGWDNILSALLMAFNQQALFKSDPSEDNLFNHLSSHHNVPHDWKLRAASIEPMASFRAEFNVDGKQNSFFCVNSTVGALGPTAYISEPQLTVNTLFPENENMDMSRFINNDFKHPLLFY